MKKNIFIKCYPVQSERTGENVKNQYIIVCDNKYIFQSYNSIIAIYDEDTKKLTFGIDWNYSITTLKYLYQFLRKYCYFIYSNLPAGKSKKDTLQKAINAGIIEYNEGMF